MGKVYVATNSHNHIVSFSVKDNDVVVYYPDKFLGDNFLNSLSLSDGESGEIIINEESEIRDILNIVNRKIGFGSKIEIENVRILNMNPGMYFPRMWRGVYHINSANVFNEIDNEKIYGPSYISSRVAVSSIFDALEGLFLYIEPDEINMNSFSHKIRELLIISCTEIESSWRSVLEANTTNLKDRYNTADYYKLFEPLYLKKWAVSLKDYPSAGKFSPFSEWKESCPTNSLPWYASYNAVKHHREANFSQANLKNLINSTAALYIMQAAQWGPEIYDFLFGNHKSPFQLVDIPIQDISEVYLSDFIEGKEPSKILFFDLR